MAQLCATTRRVQLATRRVVTGGGVFVGHMGKHFHQS